MIIDYVARVISRSQLNEAQFSFENGEQLVAIVPYSTSDDVTVVTMKKRIDVQIVSTGQDIIDAESRVN